MKMHLDWYDRSILSFVLESALLSKPHNGTSPVQFGLDARRIARRFDVILDAYGSRHLPLDDADQELVCQAVRYRTSTATPAVV